MIDLPRVGASSSMTRRAADRRPVFLRGPVDARGRESQSPTCCVRGRHGARLVAELVSRGATASASDCTRARARHRERALNRARAPRAVARCAPRRRGSARQTRRARAMMQRSRARFCVGGRQGAVSSRRSTKRPLSLRDVWPGLVAAMPSSSGRLRAPGPLQPPCRERRSCFTDSSARFYRYTYKTVVRELSHGTRRAHQPL